MERIHPEEQTALGKQSCLESDNANDPTQDQMKLIFLFTLSITPFT
jgi:hypothetical protein